MIPPRSPQLCIVRSPVLAELLRWDTCAVEVSEGSDDMAPVLEVDVSRGELFAAPLVVLDAIPVCPKSSARHPGSLFPGGGSGAQCVVLEVLTATLVARSGVGLSREDDETRTAW
jgi:hypothetical protein